MTPVTNTPAGQLKVGLPLTGCISFLYSMCRLFSWLPLLSLLRINNTMRNNMRCDAGRSEGGEVRGVHLSRISCTCLLMEHGELGDFLDFLRSWFMFVGGWGCGHVLQGERSQCSDASTFLNDVQFVWFVLNQGLKKTTTFSKEMNS